MYHKQTSYFNNMSLNYNCYFRKLNRVRGWNGGGGDDDNSGGSGKVCVFVGEGLPI